jgi:hypothetical protein
VRSMLNNRLSYILQGSRSEPRRLICVIAAEHVTGICFIVQIVTNPLCFVNPKSLHDSALRRSNVHFWVVSLSRRFMAEEKLLGEELDQA